MTAGIRGAGAFLAGALVSSLVLTGGVGVGSTAPPAERVDLAAYFKDGPPARVTGGFGEDSCHACHFDNAWNDGKGELAVSGLPPKFVPGESYRLEVVVSRPGMAVAGFQLAVRRADDGTQAGTLAVPAEEAGRVALVADRSVDFAQHLLDGIELVAEDTGRWSLLWTAPEKGYGVVLHASAVAGDGDDSQMGDHVYTVELATEPSAH